MGSVPHRPSEPQIHVYPWNGGTAHRRNDITSCDRFTDCNEVLCVVCVARCQPATVRDLDQITVARAELRNGDDSIGGGNDQCFVTPC